MSRSGSTQELVSRLAHDLEPVRPLAPVRRQVLAVVAAWLLSAAIVAAWLGLHPLAVLQRSGISAGFAWGLAGVGLAAALLGLACRIPGRERLALWAAGGVALGLVAIAVLGLWIAGSPGDAGGLAQGVRCTARSLLFALPPGAVATLLALRGATWRPRACGLALALGAAAQGALLVHLSCPSPSAWHWLFAHAVGPLGIGLAAGLALGSLLRRLGRRARLATDRRLGI